MRTLADFFDAIAQSVDLAATHRSKVGATSNARAAAWIDWNSIATYEKLEDGTGFKDWLQARRATLERIDRGDAISSQDLDGLKSLLEAVGKLSLTQAQALRQRGEAGRARKSWQLALRS